MSSPDPGSAHCLLENDNLITSISVSTDRLLEQVVDESEVILVIRVLTKVTLSTPVNISLS
jgi:predicted ATP-grasp superfamily ATP-dependent carboligase